MGNTAGRLETAGAHTEYPESSDSSSRLHHNRRN